jgi:hypothetical protein
MRHTEVCFESKIVKGRRVLFVGYLLLLIAVFIPLPASAHHPFDIGIEVWSNQSFAEPFCSDAPVEIYFRVTEVGYITVYQINPWGGVEIIYPLPHHHWRPVYPRRTYRLIDLAPDIFLLYDGAEGYAHIGIIATPQPVHLVPWLEAGFRECGLVFGRPARAFEPERYHARIDFRLVINRVEADLRLRLGPRCVPSFYVAPIYVRPRIVVAPPPVRAFGPARRWRAFEPDWRYRDRYDPDDRTPPKTYTPPPDRPEPAKPRPFDRRGIEPPQKKLPESRREQEPPSGPEARPSPERNSVKKSEGANARKEAAGSDRGSTSRAPERRVKKPRN